MASTISGYIGKLKIGSDGTAYSLGSTAYGVCSTAANEPAKTVEMTGFTLITGATIFVKFTNTNSAASPTLNVNNKGAKALVKYGTEVLNWQAGAVLCLTYDGTYWVGSSVTLKDLGLTNAMHFIGKATVVITDGGTENPTITGYDFTNNKQAGDVVIGKEDGREYVWTAAGAWELLGQDASTTVDSGAPATNTWISRVQQNSDRTITVTTGTLDTSGTWSGNAATATKWLNPQKVYVTLGTASTTTTIQGGSSSAQTIGVNGTLGTANGGTGNTSFTANTIIYANTATKLASYTSTKGGTKKLWYLNAGVPTDSTANEGGARNPVYLSSGSITAGDVTFDTLNANRLMWTSDADKPYAGYHYADSTHVAINSYATPSSENGNNYNFYVSGTSRFAIGDNDNTSNKRFIIGSSGNRYLSFGGAGIQAYKNDDAAGKLFLQYGGGDFSLGENVAVTTGLFNITTATMTGTYTFNTTGGFIYSGIESGSTNVARPVWFAATGSSNTIINGKPVYDNDFTYNPSTNTLTVATVAGNATSADKVNKNLVIKINTGSTEGTSLYTYNGSAAKTLDIKTGTGISFGTLAAGVLTIGHSNSVTAKTAYGSTATTASADGGTIKVTDVKYDAQGHITASTDRTITLSQVKNTAGSTNTSSKIYLIGATEQAANPQTYSDDEVFATDGELSVRKLKITSTAGIKHIEFSRASYNYIWAPDSGSVAIGANSTVSVANSTVIATATTLYPGTDSTVSLGIANNHWKDSFFDTVYVSSNTGYTSSTSAQNGTTISGAGWIDMTTESTSVLPHIDFKIAKSALDYQVRLDSNSPGRLRVVRDTTNVTTSKAAPNQAANLTYNSRNIDPIFHVVGKTYVQGDAETSGYFLNNTNVNGSNDTNGYYIYGNAAQYGRLFINKIGTAGTYTPGEEGAAATTTNGTLGEVYLILGNATPQTPTDASHLGANNARGRIQLYGTGANCTEIIPQPNGNRIFYLPNYANTMYAVHAGSNAAVGTATKPVYVAANGRVTEGSYGLNATVNSGTASYMAYYSGANAISPTSIARVTALGISIYPTTAASYGHGMRIHSISNWSAILLCGNDQTTDAGTSANSWFVGNNNGNFYITRNGSTSSSSAMLACVSNVWSWNGTATGNISGNAGTATYWQNRGGSTVSIGDSSWALQFTPSGQTNRAVVWGQKWTQSGLTYTPSGGSATTNTDTADLRFWLSSGNAANTLQVNMQIDGKIYAANGFKGALEGNASTATTLQTARTINGTSFNGSANITTANWGTARTLTIGSTGKSVNGSANVSWSLAEIGATVSNAWTAGTTAGPTIKTTVNGVTGTAVAIPSASASASGVVTTGEQTFGGKKIFNTEATFSAANQFRLIQGNYGVIFRNDGSNFYILMTASGSAASGSWTSARPLTIANSTGVCSINGNAATASQIYSSASTSKAYVLGTTTASSANHATVYNASVYTSGSVLYGAAWNDYAEFRQTKKEIEPGRCIREIGDDTLEITTKRLERGCEIVSDTYGFAIGETETCQTPIASSGRVLAYPYESREEFASHIGWPVCSGPNGTVSIMTEEEEEKYPSRIIGTISAVPDYEEWGTGNVKVNGRVWIRIR